MEGGKENTRVKVGVFAAAMRFSMMPLPGRDEMMGAGLEKEEGMEDDEVECLIAGLIYKVCLDPLFLLRSPNPTNTIN